MRFRLPFQARSSHGFQSELLNFQAILSKKSYNNKTHAKILNFFRFQRPSRQLLCFLATLWQTTVIFLSDKREQNAYPHSSPRHRERTVRATSSRPIQREIKRYKTPNSRIQYYTGNQTRCQANTNKCSHFIKK